jgi:hypothetical protein
VLINPSGLEHIVSSDRAVTNCAAAEAGHSQTKAVSRTAATTGPSQRTNRDEEFAALGPAIDSDGVAYAIIV